MAKEGPLYGDRWKLNIQWCSCYSVYRSWNTMLYTWNLYIVINQCDLNKKCNKNLQIRNNLPFKNRNLKRKSQWIGLEHKDKTAIWYTGTNGFFHHCSPQHDPNESKVQINLSAIWKLHWVLLIVTFTYYSDKNCLCPHRTFGCEIFSQ